MVLVWGHDTCGDSRGHFTPQHPQAPPWGHGWREGTLLPIQILLPVGCSGVVLVLKEEPAGIQLQAPRPEGILKRGSSSHGIPGWVGLI